MQGDIETDVAVIGSGSTGLATALYLAREHGVQATVLEANQLAWGCSSRSGGQGQNASGRLKRSQWIARWGTDVAQRLDAEIRPASRTSVPSRKRSTATRSTAAISMWRTGRRLLPALAAEAEVMRRVFGYATRMISAEELRADHCDEREAAGAMFEAEGIGIHPLKLSYGLARAARALGARLHTGSPVQSWQREGGMHLLRTPGGTVRARRVAVCTGGYTGQALSRC